MIINEMKAKAPISLALLQGCTSVSTSEPSEYTDTCSIVGLIFVILLRNQNQNMNLVQRIISVILYCGHAQKQVSNSSVLQKVGHIIYFLCIGF